MLTLRLDLKRKGKMYLVLPFGNYEKKMGSVCSNHSSKQERRRGEPTSSFLIHVSLLSGALLPRKAACLLVLLALHHPAELRHGLVQRGAGSFQSLSLTVLIQSHEDSVSCETVPHSSGPSLCHRP